MCYSIDWIDCPRCGCPYDDCDGPICFNCQDDHDRGEI